MVSQSLGAALREVNDDLSKYLGIELEETLVCQESDAEPAVTKTEHANKLICNIQGGPGTSAVVNHLHEGLKLALEGAVEKHSAVLGRNALWKRVARVSKLPKYICVQFMRFFWKLTPESRDHAGVKCKILRSVGYSEVTCTLLLWH